ncbi:hypothetical protein GR160_01155 [Flavobacterium sp. Sd200]|uniref:M949_RS01915 family surface polysaccharide biosynthesis protein n=1 Tax=Flavobacterium sp. Sd200 TaxID=2692211 RepID=UPI001371C8DD|nr:hypothetical protein [Flavobacterium sp. Sd200]MXN89823.1 hypothetical protein [Flavobacterium sp. Sd200]
MYKTILLIFLSITCFAQLKAIKLTTKDIPESIEYKGNIVDAQRFKDDLGEHIILITETGVIDNKSSGEELYREAELFAYKYLLSDGKWALQWKVYDFIKECPVDVEAKFIKDAFTVTDLNKNGRAEVWLMYKIACYGDVSPAETKIIMYEEGKKYAMRGEEKITFRSTKDKYGGQYIFDQSFKKAPVSFREYAKALWTKYAYRIIE